MIHHYAAFVVGSVVVWGSVAAFVGLVYGVERALSACGFGDDEWGAALAICIFGPVFLGLAGWACHSVGAAVLGGGAR